MTVHYLTRARQQGRWKFLSEFTKKKTNLTAESDVFIIFDGPKGVSSEYKTLY